MIVHWLTTSKLDYCNYFNMGLPLKTTQKQRLVLNRVAYICHVRAAVTSNNFHGTIQR